MSDIKKWIKLIESSYDYGEDDEDDDRFDHVDDPRIPEFKRLLSLWGEGWANSAWGKPKLHQEMLALREVAGWWHDLHGSNDLYRAFIPTVQQVKSLQKTGQFVIQTPVNRPLASWSLTEQGCMEWISGFDNWLMFEKTSLQIYTNYMQACHDLFGEFSNFDEVIVIMPPKLVITTADIVQSYNIPNLSK